MILGLVWYGEDKAGDYILIIISLNHKQNNKGYAYRLCGKKVLSNHPIEELAHLFTGYEDGQKVITYTAGEVANHAPLIFDEPGWVGNAWRHVTCYGDQSGYRLQVEGVGRFIVSEDGNQIIYRKVELLPVDSQALNATILGPPLILGLALKDIWCLHASAIFKEGCLILFIGESGQGKSTLARELVIRPENDCLLAADDITPVIMTSGDLVGLPHFPQLKLDAQSQPAINLPQRVRVGAIYAVQKEQAHRPVKEIKLNQKNALLALIRHSVASQLFNRLTLERHLDFCTYAAGRIPVYKLHYPHRLTAVAEVAAQLNLDQTTKP